MDKKHQDFILADQDIKTHPKYEKKNHKEEGKECKYLWPARDITFL